MAIHGRTSILFDTRKPTWFHSLDRKLKTLNTLWVIKVKKKNQKKTDYVFMRVMSEAEWTKTEALIYRIIY